MNKMSERRELIVLDDLNIIAHATYHVAYNDIACQSRIGVLFLNGLAATRAGNGDATVYWADSFAAFGYPSFRLDLPGFGDSSEDPPEDWLDFINRGDYTSAISAKIRELVSRFNLSGVIIMGHCSGAVEAIFAAKASQECKGLVLMDPSFQLSRTTRPKLRAQLSIWAMNNRFGGVLSNLFDYLKKIRLLLRGNTLPDNANLALLRCWKEVVPTGLPILILKAPGLKTQGVKPRTGQFDYFKYVLKSAGRRSQILVQSVDGANHSFANRAGRLSVREHAKKWLNNYFPLTRPEENTGVAPHSWSGTVKMPNQAQHKFPQQITFAAESENHQI